MLWYVIWVVKIPREGYKFRKGFWPKINIPQGSYCILSTDVLSGKLSKSAKI